MNYNEWVEELIPHLPILPGALYQRMLDPTNPDGWKWCISALHRDDLPWERRDQLTRHVLAKPRRLPAKPLALLIAHQIEAGRDPGQVLAEPLPGLGWSGVTQTSLACEVLGLLRDLPCEDRVLDAVLRMGPRAWLLGACELG